MDEPICDDNMRLILSIGVLTDLLGELFDHQVLLNLDLPIFHFALEVLQPFDDLGHDFLSIERALLIEHDVECVRADVLGELAPIPSDHVQSLDFGGPLRRCR